MPICIDWRFITGEEGRELKGYVPPSKDPKKGKKRGVTIATGVDLGQRSPAQIKRLPLPNDLKNRLIPYVLKRGPEAVAFLKKHPLTITDARLLDNAIRTAKFEVVGQLIENYDRAIRNKPGTASFQWLPCEAQTVITSVAYQYGRNLFQENAAPRFWGIVTEQDWEGAVGELRNFNDPERQPRRNREADLLDSYVARESIQWFLPSIDMDWRDRAIQP